MAEERSLAHKLIWTVRYVCLVLNGCNVVIQNIKFPTYTEVLFLRPAFIQWSKLTFRLIDTRVRIQVILELTIEMGQKTVILLSSAKVSSAKQSILLLKILNQAMQWRRKNIRKKQN